jgi:periplasmic copper chaperone A
MTMRPVGPLPVGPGKPLVLAPGGYHVMLMGLKQPLKAGDSFPVTLTFAKAGAINATASVGKAGAPAPQAGMGAMDMGHMAH